MLCPHCKQRNMIEDNSIGIGSTLNYEVASNNIFAGWRCFNCGHYIAIDQPNACPMPPKCSIIATARTSNGERVYRLSGVDRIVWEHRAYIKKIVEDTPVAAIASLLRRKNGGRKGQYISVKSCKASLSRLANGQLEELIRMLG